MHGWVLVLCVFAMKCWNHFTNNFPSSHQVSLTERTEPGGAPLISASGVRFRGHISVCGIYCLALHRVVTVAPRSPLVIFLTWRAPFVANINFTSFLFANCYSRFINIPNVVCSVICTAQVLILFHFLNLGYQFYFKILAKRLARTAPPLVCWTQPQPPC